MTESEVHSIVTATVAPLWIALHEKGLISLDEMALFYEDAAARRKFDLGETDEQTALAQGIAAGIHRLADAVRASELAAKAKLGNPPSA